MQQSILQEFLSYIEAGGWVMPPLIVLLVVLWYAIGYRAMALVRGTRKNPRVLLAKVERKPERADAILSGEGILVSAARKGLALRERGFVELRGFLDDAFAEEYREIRKFDVLIKTIVGVAPLLGLLGTVIGMIETFDSLGDMSLYSQSGGIAGGISQALFTTQMGLAVSIPGLLVNGVLGRKQKDLELQLAQMKDILCADRSAALQGA